MWRALFLAVGITLCILGAEGLVFEKAILSESFIGDDAPRPAVARSLGRREYAPPEWVPWSLLSGGAVVILYSFTIPRRVTG